MLGAIPRQELVSYRESVDRFVESDTGDDPPAPLRDTDLLLDWVCKNSVRVHEAFSRPNASAELDAIVAEYL